MGSTAEFTAPRIRVAFADDSVLFRQLVSRELEAKGDIEIIISVSNGSELIDALRKAPCLPDVCLVDARMPKMDGFTAISILHNKWKAIKLLVLSDYSHSGFIDHMKWKGANDYLSKNSSAEVIAQAIRDVFNGSKPEAGLFPPGDHLKEESRRNQKVLSHLSPMELQFLELSATSLSNDEIKQRMNISKASGEGYRSSLFKKFDVTSRTGLIIEAVRLGLIVLDPEPKE
jgi:two-component system invasion response regulator UvrY